MKSLNIKKIKELINSQDLQQKEFAKKIGLTVGGLQYIFKEKSTNTDTLIKISEILNTPIGYFFDETDAPKGAHVIQTIHGNQNNVSNGEKACKLELEAANKKIIELQDKIIKLQEKKKINFKI